MNESITKTAPPCHAGRWRAATIACLLVMAIAAAAGASMYEQFKAQLAHLQAQLRSAPQVRYIAVLLDDKRAPAMLVTLDPQERALRLQRLNNVTEGREDTMQLWATAADGKARSLGILEGRSKTLQLPADDKTLQDVSQLAISVENKGGVTQAQGPRLPYLFTGAVVQKAL